MGVNNKEGMMKTSWGKPVHVISFCRTLLIVLAVAVCTVAADDLQTLRKKAEAGDAISQFNLGLMYDKGEGVAEDDAEAVKWFRKAAEQGHATAQFNLGLMYHNGSGVPKDDVAAVKWYRKAAEQGHAQAQFDLVVPYALGFGLPKDNAEAITWCRKAAEQGHAKAQAYLGRIYDNGNQNFGAGTDVVPQGC
jgi:TPR repeat protein